MSLSLSFFSIGINFLPSYERRSIENDDIDRLLLVHSDLSSLIHQVGEPLEKAALKGIEWSYKSDEKAMPKKGGGNAVQIVQRHHFASHLKWMAVVVRVQENFLLLCRQLVCSVCEGNLAPVLLHWNDLSALSALLEVGSWSGSTVAPLECMLQIVVTAPMSTINAIAVEAYKKYILVSLIHLGQVQQQVPYITTTLMDVKLGMEGRKDLFDWLSRQLSGLSNFPDAVNLLKPTAFAMDKSADVRKAAEVCIGEIFRVCGLDALFLLFNHILMTLYSNDGGGTFGWAFMASSKVVKVNFHNPGFKRTLLVDPYWMPLLSKSFPLSLILERMS
ncbi:Protein MOR1 [Camellia lanceoleosa]|uniref:Protein MOR1 n=1 Tax=Camellia lanceoleosa TaxID=1840588 RepID=A0ACC0GD07_9ERIC|nr:Protein MOR1 [Camellia lanceoleosa]